MNIWFGKMHLQSCFHVKPDHYSCTYCACILLHSSCSDFKLMIMIWSAEKHELVQKEIQNGTFILKMRVLAFSKHGNIWKRVQRTDSSRGISGSSEPMSYRNTSRYKWIQNDTNSMVISLPKISGFSVRWRLSLLSWHTVGAWDSAWLISQYGKGKVWSSGAEGKAACWVQSWVLEAAEKETVLAFKVRSDVRALQTSASAKCANVVRKCYQSTLQYAEFQCSSGGLEAPRSIFEGNLCFKRVPPIRSHEQQICARARLHLSAIGF